MIPTPPHPTASSFDPRTWLPLTPFAFALFVIFVANVVGSVLPIRLLDPLWQLNFVAVLIDNAPVALLGLGFIHLQAYLEPDEEEIRSLRYLVARLAVAAVLGFLLLVPLQIVASVQVWQAAHAAELKRTASINADFTLMRQAILGATSPQDLQQRLQRLQRLRAPLLAAADQSASFEPLRQRLLASLQSARKQALSQVSSASGPRLWSLLSSVPRNLICSLALAAAFAAGARSHSTPVPLLSKFFSLLSRDRPPGPSASFGPGSEDDFNCEDAVVYKDAVVSDYFADIDHLEPGQRNQASAPSGHDSTDLQARY